MKIRACIIFEIPDPKDRGAALEEAEDTLLNAINNGDLNLHEDSDGFPIEAECYSITVEEVEG